MPRTIKSRPSASRMTLRPALLLLAAANTAPSVLSESCSCAPTKYSFRLSLSQDCSTNDISGNDGIDESLCFVESGVTLPRSVGNKRVKSSVDQMVDRYGGLSTEATTAAPHSTDDADLDSGNGEQVRRSRQLSSTPVEIISIQYLEFDTSGNLNVIHTDDSYIDTNLVDGDVFEFYSMSSMPGYDADENSVGGASLILYGKDEAGETIRNRFFWTFEDCEGAVEGVQEGDGIGWIIVEDISGPYPENCPGLSEDSPTISPRTDEPTYEPTFKPTPSPQASVSWETPSPNSAEGSDDQSGTSTDDIDDGSTNVDGGSDDVDGGSDDVDGGSDDVDGGSNDVDGGSNDVDGGSNDSEENLFGSTSAPAGYYGPSNPSPGTKPGKPVYNSKAGSQYAYGNGKTHKHPYDKWSFDGGHYPVEKSAKAFGKSGKHSKTSSKSMKNNGYYSDDSWNADDGYPHAPRLFNEAYRNGENIR